MGFCFLSLNTSKVLIGAMAMVLFIGVLIMAV